MDKIRDYDKEIVNFLKKNYRQMFSAREISLLFKIPQYRVCQKLKILEKYGIIESEVVDRKVAVKIYGSNFKRGLRLYCFAQS
ncbi:MAG TPA: hypothetical protein VFG01_08620 [Acidobacteriota bacterium]|nr:hypothetical protein [Acidobacteriota bacterium]